MCTYVYAGNFEGIQSYIYGTDKLREIVGASELLNEICSEELFTSPDLREKFGFNLKFDGKFEIIQAAASKLRIVFEEPGDCENMKREFPKIVRNAVPGIEFSQAWAEQKSGETKTIDDEVRRDLENQLAKEKNCPSTLYYPNLMIVERANRTGLPITGKTDDTDQERLDEANLQKRKMTRYFSEHNAHRTLTNKVFFGTGNIDNNFLEKHSLPVEIGQISNSNSFIAVVHADGNGLGNLIQKMKNTPLREFSKALDNCTVNSAKDAFEEVVKRDGNWKLDKTSGRKVYPFRPIILGGDDFTFVCKADDAVEFTKRFIQIFEEKTAKEECLNKNGGKLTVCAGIAFVKENYPLHFAYKLAESLCELAKDNAKELQKDRKNGLRKNGAPQEDIDNVAIPSCIAFRKELGSFVDDFENIKEGRDAKFIFRPYAVYDRKDKNQPCLDDKLPHIDDLIKVVEILGENSSFKTFLRNWMSEELAESGSAELLKERFMQVVGEQDAYDNFRTALGKLVPQKNKGLALELNLNEGTDEPAKYVSPILDILTLISVGEENENN